MKKLITFITILIFSTLGANILFTPGIPFILDSGFYPFNGFNGFFNATLYFHLQDLLNFIFGYVIFSKIQILGTFIIGSLFGIYLAKYIIDVYEIKNKNHIFFFQSVSIIFTLFNPFIYERFTTQVSIALGVFTLGFGIISLLNFIKNNQNKNLYLSSLFFGITLTIFPHSLLLIFLFCFVFYILYFKKFSIKNISISALIFLSLNINWIVGDVFLQTSGPTQSVKNFSELNVEAFKSNSLAPMNVEGTHLLLYGFWGEKYGHVLTPVSQNPNWFIAGFMVLFIVFIGILSFYKKNKKLTISLLIIGIISYVLSLGVTSQFFYSINKFLFDNIPYYVGMREPHKWLGLTTMIYSIFFLIGIKYLLDMGISFLKKFGFELNKYVFNVYTWVILVFVLIFAWSPNILRAYNGQFRIGNYPYEYFELKSFMDQNIDKKSKIAIFPWHSYMACDYSFGKIFSNVIYNIFGKYDFVIADNIEIGPVYSNNNSIISKNIEEYLNNKDLQYLEKDNIKYIINLKTCADSQNYKFLQKNTDFKNIFNSNKIDLYEINYK